MKKILGVLVMLLLSKGVLAKNEFLEVNRLNCNKINGHGIHEKEAIARAYKVPMSSVVLVDAKWGPSQFGGEQCNMIFDTAKGPKRCNVFLILTDDKGKTAFGLAVPQQGSNPVCF